MEPSVVDNIGRLLESLIEEKHQIKLQVHSLNRLYQSHEAKIEELAELYKDVKMHQDIQREKEKRLNVPERTTGNKAVQCDIALPSNDKASKPAKQRKNANFPRKSIRKCKDTLKLYRKSMASLVSEIKQEMDIFQVCFAADVETLNLKFSVAEESPQVIATGVIVSEMVSHGNDDEDIKTEIAIESYPGDKELENFSIIKFPGLQRKKPKARKK